MLVLVDVTVVVEIVDVLSVAVVVDVVDVAVDIVVLVEPTTRLRSTSDALASM